MSSTRESNPIAHDVRTTCLNRAYVSRRDLCASHSIDELQPGNGAALVVGPKHNPTKNPITQNS